MVGTIAADLSLVLVPLLSLTADLLEGLREGSLADALVESQHIDKLLPDVVRETLVPRLDSLQGDSSSNIFLLCSPQELATNGSLCATLLVRSHGRGVLCLVALDGAHLYAHNSTTFCGCICFLLDQLFRVVLFRTSGCQHPLVLAMSATMTLLLYDYLARLTTIPWKKSRHHLLCSAAEFRQQDIFLNFELSSDIGQVALPKFVAHLCDSPNSCIYIFCESLRRDCLERLKKLP